MIRPPSRVLSRIALTLAILAGTAGCDPTSSDVRDNVQVAGVVSLDPDDIERFDNTETIADVHDLEVLDDGSVWVLNSVAPFFVAFGVDGTMVEAYGAEGGGPEEFQMPAGFVVGGLEGEAWVFDLRRHALIRIAGSDGPWEDRPLTAFPPGTLQGGMGLLSNMVRTAAWGGDVVVPHSTGTLESGPLALVEAILKAELARMTPDGAEARILVDLGGTLDDPFPGFAATEGGLPLWKRLWAVCGDELRVYDRVRNQLRGFEATGEEVRPLDLPDRRLASVSAEEFVQAVLPLMQAEAAGTVSGAPSSEDSAAIARQAVQEITSSGEELAAYLPEWVDLRCSPSGTVWAQPYGRDSGGIDGGREWVRIAGEGETTEVILPEGFEAMRFTDERIWGVARDAFDVPTVAWIALPS